MAEAAPLEVDVQDESDGRIVRAAGEINLNTSPTLLTRLNQAMQGATVLKVNLAAVEFIDSSGIAVLVRVYKQAQEAGIAMSLTEPSKKVRSVLELTNVWGLFPIETTDDR